MEGGSDPAVVLVPGFVIDFPSSAALRYGMVNPQACYGGIDPGGHPGRAIKFGTGFSPPGKSHGDSVKYPVCVLALGPHTTG